MFCLHSLDSVIMLVRVVVLLTVGCASVSAAVPRCDPAVTNKMSQFHPNGVPMHIIQSVSVEE
jgi:hypothetical protein